MKLSKEAKGDSLILIAMLIFGSYALFLRAFPAIPTISFLFFFQLVGAISFFLIALKRNLLWVNRKDLLFLLGLAIFAVANDLMYFQAFRLTSIANTALPHQMVSIFLIFLAPYFLKEKTNKYEWTALVVSILGLVIIYWNGISLQSGQDLLGITLGLASALFYALIIIFFRLTSQRGLTISTISFWRYTFSVIMMFPFMFLFGGFNVTNQDFVPLIIFGIIFAVIASAIHISGLIQTRALHASILGKSEPVIAILYGIILLNETPSMQVIIGGVLIIGAGVWLAFLSPKLSS